MTDLDIVNSAIASLGCNKITAIDDTTAEGQIAGAEYAIIRDALLQARAWTFAKGRVQGTQLAQPPLFGYAYQFTLDTSVLAIIRVYGPGGLVEVTDWDVEQGPAIVTDQAGPVYAEVIKRVSESAFSPLFIRALIARLAADWAMALTENRALADSWETKAEDRLVTAAAKDGKQGSDEVITVPRMPGRKPCAALFNKGQ